MSVCAGRGKVRQACLISNFSQGFWVKYGFLGLDYLLVFLGISTESQEEYKEKKLNWEKIKDDKVTGGKNAGKSQRKGTWILNVPFALWCLMLFIDNENAWKFLPKGVKCGIFGWMEIQSLLSRLILESRAQHLDRSWQFWRFRKVYFQWIKCPSIHNVPQSSFLETIRVYTSSLLPSVKVKCDRKYF